MSEVTLESVDRHKSCFPNKPNEWSNWTSSTFHCLFNYQQQNISTWQPWWRWRWKKTISICCENFFFSFILQLDFEAIKTKWQTHSTWKIKNNHHSRIYSFVRSFRSFCKNMCCDLYKEKTWRILRETVQPFSFYVNQSYPITLKTPKIILSSRST